MKGFLEKIAAADFRKPVKRLILITLAVILVCGALNAYMFRTQISEIAALKSTEEQTARQSAEQAAGEKSRSHERDEENLFDSGLVTRPSAAALATAVTSVVLCGLCALAYWLTVAAWLYKAAAGAGMNRALWTILGLLLNLPALLAFLIVRGRMTRCPACGAWQKPGFYCAACGAKLQTACPACGKISPAASGFCPHCGTALQGGAAGTDKA